MKNKPAFSLVEMLMALLVASLLLAALAPVMTRKFNDNVNVNGLGEPVKAPADMQCYPYTDANPTVKVPLNDVYYANFIIASAGGGGAGATSSVLSALKSYTKISTETATSTVTYDEQAINISEYMTNVKIEYAIGAGGGGGGGSVARPFEPSDAACSSYGSGKTDTAGNSGTNFAIYDNLALCVTKFNQKHSSGCYSGSSSNCTSSSAMSYTYSGCNRTVCKSSVLKNICSNLASSTGNYWRYPTLTEIARWGNSTTRWKKLALCAYGASHTVSLCGTYGVADSVAHPYCIFSRSPMPDGIFHASCLTQGNPDYDTNWYAMGEADSERPRSVRCVYDGTSALSGAGGSSGSIMSNIDITEYVKTAGVNGKIILQAGRGGKGGEKSTTKGTAAKTGEDGGKSCLYVQKSNGERVYGLCAYGGKGGSPGDITKGTAAPKSNAWSTCMEWKNSSDGWNSISCSTNSNSGTAGIVGTDPETTVAGGIGGKGTRNEGAGGSGGSALYDSYRSNITTGSGEDGVGGVIRITYQNEFSGAGGGGGGAGSVAIIKNIYVGKSTECTFTMGKGGSGGNIDNNGLNGGLSSVKCESDSRTFTVNGGSGGKKGTSAQDISSLPTGGGAGIFGDANEYIYALELEKRDIKKALTTNEEKNKMKGVQNAGGKGQTSGTGAQGGCGGLYSELNICEVSDTDANRINGKGFVYTDTIVPTSKDIQDTSNSSYGIAGAGGGGAGWVRGLGAGKGGNGMNGYVCVYWYGE